MPVLIPSNEKQAFISLVSVAPYPGGAGEADRLQSVLVYYSDVVTAVYRNLEQFAENPNYLKQAIACFNDNQLQGVGIWNNKTVASPPLTDPVLLINSQYTEVILSPTSPYAWKTLGLLGNSSIGTLYLTSGCILNELLFGPGCTIDIVNSSAPVQSPPLSSPPVGAMIQKIYLTNQKNNPSALNAATYESQIGQVIIDPGSYYGGIQSNNPDAACTQPVTNVVITETTKNGVLVSWNVPAPDSPPSSPPNNYLFINTFYRLSNSKPWILATEDDGDFQGDSGFIFRHLQPDTFYDVMISVTCALGGINSVTTTFKTVCCGAGTVLTQYKKCEITVNIVTTPDPTHTLTLCNGTVIALEYAPGPTLVLPYLIGRGDDVDRTVIVDNVPYQNFPYDDSSGTFNAGGTSLLNFIATNVVTVSVNLPV